MSKRNWVLKGCWRKCCTEISWIEILLLKKDNKCNNFEQFQKCCSLFMFSCNNGCCFARLSTIILWRFFWQILQQNFRNPYFHFPSCFHSLWNSDWIWKVIKVSYNYGDVGINQDKLESCLEVIKSRCKNSFPVCSPV